MGNIMKFLRGILGYNNPQPSDFGPEDEELNKIALESKDVKSN